MIHHDDDFCGPSPGPGPGHYDFPVLRPSSFESAWGELVTRRNVLPVELDSELQRPLNESTVPGTSSESEAGTPELGSVPYTI